LSSVLTYWDGFFCYALGLEVSRDSGFESTSMLRRAQHRLAQCDTSAAWKLDIELACQAEAGP